MHRQLHALPAPFVRADGGASNARIFSAKDHVFLQEDVRDPVAAENNIRMTVRTVRSTSENAKVRRQAIVMRAPETTSSFLARDELRTRLAAHQRSSHRTNALRFSSVPAPSFSTRTARKKAAAGSPLLLASLFTHLPTLAGTHAWTWTSVVFSDLGMEE